MTEELLLVEKRGATATVTINRPELRNAISGEMWAAFPKLFGELSADPELRAIVLRGAGERAFAAGADVTRFGSERSDPAQWRAYHSAIDEAMASIEHSPKAVIAMIYGYALGGGCELAAACDMRIAGESAKFGVPSARLSIVIGLKDTRRLVWLIGPAHTRQMLMSGQTYSAQEALRIGLVNEVVPDAELERHTYDLAARIAANAPFSVAGAKASVLACMEDPSLAATSEVDELSVRALQSEDHKEGLRAFAEKRSPVFRGR